MFPYQLIYAVKKGDAAELNRLITSGIDKETTNEVRMDDGILSFVALF
jgi:hypothetical protein